MPGDLAAHEREVLGAVEQRLEHVGGEVAVLGRDARLGHAAHELLAVAAVADEVGDRDEHEPVLGRERLELGQALHRAVVVDDLGEHAGREAAGEAGEVDRGLGVPGALQHAALAVAQREDVAGPREVARRASSGRSARAPSSPRSAAEMPVVVPSFASTETVNAVRCYSVFSVPDDHQRELQLVEPLALHRQADDAARVADHERHLLGRHLLGRDDEVALVLAVLVVDDDDELAAPRSASIAASTVSKVIAAPCCWAVRSRVDRGAAAVRRTWR